MPTFAETIRGHYQAGIKDETELLTRLNRIIDEIEPPLTAEKFAAFDQFHVGGLAATGRSTEAGCREIHRIQCTSFRAAHWTASLVNTARKRPRRGST